MIINTSCPHPSNINPLSPNGFLLNIHKLPELSFFCQQVNLPGLSLGAPEFGTPFTQVPIAGDTLQFDPLTVQFLIDENMSNYKSIHNWLVGLGFPESHEQYQNFLKLEEQNIVSELARSYSDATLLVLGSNFTPVQTIEFTDVFPISLETIQFESSNQDVQYLTGASSFRFSHYKFV